MKRILLQLDTDEHASPFDAIVAHDAGVDVVLPYARVVPDAVPGLVQGAFFTRGPSDLASLAVWIGGSDVATGERNLAAVREAFFGPFQVSAMLDCNGCNTTAATAVAQLAKGRELPGLRAVVVGLGPVGLRAARLLETEGCEVAMATIPAYGERAYHRPSGLEDARRRGLQVVETPAPADLATALDGASIVLAAGPAGMQVLPRELWQGHPTVELLADFNAAEPLGIEGVEATDDLVERDGKVVLGALGVGGLKQKVHKAAVRGLFERNDAVLDVEEVYALATEMA